MKNKEDVTLTIIIGCMKFKSHFYGLNKNTQTASKMDLDLVK